MPDDMSRRSFLKRLAAGAGIASIIACNPIPNSQHTKIDNPPTITLDSLNDYQFSPKDLNPVIKIRGIDRFAHLFYSASDSGANSGIGRVEFYRDGKLISTQTSPKSIRSDLNNWQFELFCLPAYGMDHGTGTHKYKLTVIDKAGQKSSSPEFKVEYSYI
jgi:hypothetical protein